LYLIDDDLARPVVRDVADASDPSARSQALIEALVEALRDDGTWPSDLPVPRVYAFDHERDAVVVLDLPQHDADLSVASERRIVASLERTLIEDGHDRVLYLRDGTGERPWLGRLAVPSRLE
ncbi:MAG: hypothetical protein WD336_12020, partial [Trueperaceae bacterium]